MTSPRPWFFASPPPRPKKCDSRLIAKICIFSLREVTIFFLGQGKTQIFNPGFSLREKPRCLLSTSPQYRISYRGRRPRRSHLHCRIYYLRRRRIYRYRRDCHGSDSVGCSRCTGLHKVHLSMAHNGTAGSRGLASKLSNYVERRVGSGSQVTDSARCCYCGSAQ